MFAGLWELGNMVSYLLGAPHSLLALVTGKGCKQIEFLPPDGNSPGDVCLYLRRRHIPNWCWHDGAPEHDAKTGTTERRACFVVSQKQARWVEQVMLDYGCCILSPLEDQNAPRYAENVRERGGLRFWDETPRERPRGVKSAKPAQPTGDRLAGLRHVMGKKL